MKRLSAVLRRPSGEKACSGRRARVAAAIFAYLTTGITQPCIGGGIELARAGRPRAAIVTAADAAAMAAYAARELAEHVERITGARLPVVDESALPEDAGYLVYIGVTEAAGRAGLTTNGLAPDAFKLRASGNSLYVLGIEDPGADPLDENSGRAGTLFGVYELLERYAGVRWLWPGELGLHAPRAGDLRIPPLDETVTPALRFRRYRFGRIRPLRGYSGNIERLAFSREGLRAYGHDLAVFRRRHRLGDSYPKPHVGHYFTGWWRRRGAENPEWFMMRPDGRRGPGPLADPNHVAMCVSNADLRRFILEEVWDGGDLLRLGEVDRRVFCQCRACRAWDVFPPDGTPPVGADLYSPQVVSDRYARFWRMILEQAAARNPDVTVTTFLYWNYLPAPLRETRLDPRIYGEFVPWGAADITWYPMSEAADAWLREQWLGWRATGVTMAYRPNHTLAGYAMPHLNTRQGGEFLRFAHAHGMIGVDFDYLTGQWAVRGPEHYMYLRLFVDPQASIDAIMDDYFAAFGPASAPVRRYFEYWEEHNRQLHAGGRWSHMYNHPGAAPRQYPEEVYGPARELLAEALDKARRDPRPEFAARVEFLAAGLEHARLSAAMIARLARAQGVVGRLTSAFDAEAGASLRELIEFRRAHEHLYIADYLHLAHLENRRYGEVIGRLPE